MSAMTYFSLCTRESGHQSIHFVRALCECVCDKLTHRQFDIRALCVMCDVYAGHLSLRVS